MQAAPQIERPVETHDPVYQCVSCGRHFDFKKFPFRGEDNRCVFCLAKSNEDGEKSLVREEVQQAYSKLLRAAQHELTKVPTDERLLISLISQWGSLDNFACEWFEDHQNARKSGKNHKVILDSKAMIAKLIFRHNEAHQDGDVSALSDEDLARELTRVALEALDAEQMGGAKLALLKAIAKAAEYKEVAVDSPGHSERISPPPEGGLESLPAPTPPAPVLHDER